MLRAGKTEEEAVSALEYCGVDEDEIRSALNEARGIQARTLAVATLLRRTWRDDLYDFFTLRNSTLRGNSTNDGLKEMMIGVPMLLVGAGVSWVSYMGAVAEGGNSKYWVLTGAIAMGLILSVRGFVHFLTYRQK